MAGIWTLIEVAGEAALLLWGLHMVQSGIMRAYGTRLRQRLGAGLSGRRSGFTAGLLVTGLSPNGQLVEVIELRDHPWFLAVQCHPEFKSKPTHAHPLFRSFIQASLQKRETKKETTRTRSPVAVK